MLCETCKKNNATFHYRYSENGNVTEMHLCADCAKKQGLMDETPNLGSFFGGTGFFDDFFGASPFASLFGEGTSKQKLLSRSRVCPSCGMSENELVKTGKIGCKECYRTFSDLIASMLSKLHLSTEYKGKKPCGCCEEASVEQKLKKLKADMQKAVDAQEYEEAAKLRDAIRTLENASNTDENEKKD